MITPELQILLSTAISIGVIHTLTGPDHYVPFVVMAKSKGWTLKKTSSVTLMCGLGHVSSSIIIGIIGIIFGVGLSKIEFLESQRGDIAGWLFIIIGALYLIFGITKRITHQKPHTHKLPKFLTRKNSDRKISPWSLFLIFVFGPCEVLVPMLMYPAAHENSTAILLVSVTFSIATLLTMLAVVLPLSFLTVKIPFKNIHKYSNVLVGITLLTCGISIIFLGL
ncbi:sulfite exporter TauE/SafE family protein [Wenyingzhuangia sp. 2_MG-2023]|uniref:urease accessory protein UreH domain-containing protein n=1 Tax=Wenyingzhuangia sp. 2_MG-2023 TaxID=3062639 RepID=UPI0026E28123|nr:sulfite exporter TauE/SafE family protein [Wenyingzhuangia sp. 2_MG-2023]MDO6739271.1 sulfite exporter TauE/SafE family protein [Wenyingzhuangia sp. 2_MG-2023]